MLKGDGAADGGVATENCDFGRRRESVSQKGELLKWEQKQQRQGRGVERIGRERNGTEWNGMKLAREEKRRGNRERRM